MRLLKSLLLLTLLTAICTQTVDYKTVIEVDSSQESGLVTELKAWYEHRTEKTFANAIEEADARLEMTRILEENSLNDFKNLDYSRNDSCENRKKSGNVADFYYFLPTLKAKLIKEGESVEFTNLCFKKNRVTLVSLGSEIHIEFEANEADSLLCTDAYLISTSRIHHVADYFMHGKHKVVIKNVTQNDLDEIKANGIRVLSFCSGVIKSLTSLYDTLKLYLGGILTPKVPQYMEKANIALIKEFVGLNYVHRGDYADQVLNIDKNEIKTGDFVAIMRLDGLDELIMMGTGTSIGHTAVACWIDGELYVIESQDAWYWKSKKGIQRNKFDDWIKFAHDADFHVVIIPLKEEYRQKLDEDAARNWFYSKEGLDYGFRNFLFSWLDTKKNLPHQVDFEILLPVLSIFDGVAHSLFHTILGEALNLRVGTTDLGLQETLVLAANKGLSFEDLLEIPEMEGWKYSNGENYVCSCFCAGFYKAGGLFGDMEIQPQEFTPKDVYQLAFFDKDYNKPQLCKDADPDTPFCQIMGKYRVLFRDVGKFEPYNKMNERCESQAPEFIRNEGC